MNIIAILNSKFTFVEKGEKIRRNLYESHSQDSLKFNLQVKLVFINFIYKSLIISCDKRSCKIYRNENNHYKNVLKLKILFSFSKT